jgi:hypothetical protein
MSYGNMPFAVFIKGGFAVHGTTGGSDWGNISKLGTTPLSHGCVRIHPLNAKAFNEADVLQFKPHTTMEIVKRLQPWSLRKSSADVKGGVFEDFLSKTFRDDLGQYFTPTPVIN